MLSLLLISCLLGTVLSADILAIFPHTGKSHFDVFEPLVLALAARGHRLTTVSFFPQKTAVPNYTDVSLVNTAPMFVNVLKFEHVIGMNAFTDFLTITNIGVQTCEDIFMSSQVQDLLQSSKTFDLLMVEMFNTDCFLGFVNKYNVPFIGILSSSLLPHHYARLGSFDNPAYFPNLFLPLGPRMSFGQRVTNAVATGAMRFARSYYNSVPEHRSVRHALGREVSLQSIAHNVSLVLVNSHHSLQGARPLVPACIEVGGLHIHPAKPLNKVRNKDWK